MGRITITTVKNALGITNTYDIMNAIRNSQGDSFKQYVPLASADNIAEIGSGILLNQTTQNEFITALVDRIGRVVIENVSLNNQLAKFKKQAMELGKTVEQVYTDITKAHQYDPETAESQVFKREIPNVKTLFHERNRQEFYKQTIQDESLKAAFISWNNFETFIAGVMNALYNSNEVDEFKYMKLIMDTYYSKGLFKVVPTVKPNTETASREFVKKLRGTATEMTLTNGSRDFNAMAVHTRTLPEDLHLIITAKNQAEIDVDVLARAFNMDKSDFIGKVTVIDSFASPNVEAVLVDQSFFMVFDNLYHMESQRNAQGLYWNYWLHVWQTMSASRFANAVAFVSGEVEPVTQVIVDPTIAAMKQGTNRTFTAYVRATEEGAEHDVVWSVTGAGSTSIAVGTSIDQEGKLTLGANQLGELLVKATVTYDTGEVDGNDDPITKDVVGESIVTIV